MAIDHPHDALPPGYRLGPYEILRVLGRGGFGLTYQARRTGVAGDMVAIKELFPHGIAMRSSNFQVTSAADCSGMKIDAAIDMFVREATIICKISHPNIVQGIEAFQANETAYLVMRYVTGRNLKESLRDPSGFRPSPSSIPAILAPLLDALDTLHQHGLLHTDIKPDNIFLGIGYEPILIDLGSARCHEPGVVIEEASTYSAYFSAIEQMTDRLGPIGPWTDIYQLSAVLYRCITGGKLPDAVDRIQAATDPFLPLSEIPVAANYPKYLVSAIDHGLQLLPQHRPQSIAQWRKSMGKLAVKAKSAAKATPPLHTPNPVRVEPEPRSFEPSPTEPEVEISDLPSSAPVRPSSFDPLMLVAAALLVGILVLVFLIIRQ